MALQKEGLGAKKARGRYLLFQGKAISKKDHCNREIHFLVYQNKVTSKKGGDHCLVFQNNVVSKKSHRFI